MNSHRVKAILSDKDFVELVDRNRERLTKRVMSPTATLEDREKALAEYHALERLVTSMRSEAQNAKGNTDA